MWPFPKPTSAIRKYFRQREARKLLKKAQLQESYKREQLLVSSVNLSDSDKFQNSHTFLQTWHAQEFSGRTKNSFSFQADRLTPIGQASQELSCSSQYSVFKNFPQPGLEKNSPRESAADPFINICNIFWKLSLTFNPYRYGDQLVDFGSLWPSERELVSLLVESHESTQLRRLLKELCHIALFCGPLRVLKVLVDLQVVGVNQTFENGRSMLHEACLAQNLDAVVYLTAAGADPSLRDRTGKMPENLCFSPKIKSLLETSNGNVRVGGAVGPGIKQSPSLHDKQIIFDMVCNVKDFDELLLKLQKFDFDVNKEVDDNGDSLIHCAARQGVSHVPLLNLLIKICQADVDLISKEGLTALMIATQRGNSAMVDSLLCVLGANPDAENPHCRWTALHYSCYSNHDHIVSMLIKRGADFNIEDIHGARPDDIATMTGSIDAKQVIVMEREGRMQTLTSKVIQDDLGVMDLRDSDLTLTNSEGNTLIMTAARQNSCGSLSALLANVNAPVNAQHQKTLQTALAMAAWAGHAEITRILLRHGANPAIRDINGSLPIHLAIANQRGAVVHVLLQHTEALTGLQHAIELVMGQPDVHRQLRVAVQRRQREVVMPALYECAMTGDADKLFSTLEPGDSVNTVSGVGDWPLYVAVENGHLNVCKLIMQWGGDLMRKHPSNGNSVLHIAASRGHYEIVKFLLDQCDRCHKYHTTEDNKSCYSDIPSCSEVEAFVNCFNFAKKTPLILAADKGFLAVVQLLLVRGASTALLDSHSRELYKCTEYEGVQFLIETYRKRHTDNVFKAITNRQALRVLNKIFLARFDQNLRDGNQDTPLMYACLLGKIDVVQWLMKSAVFTLDNMPSHSNSDAGTPYDSDTDSGAILDTTTTTTNQQMQCSSPGVSREEVLARVDEVASPPDNEELEGSAYHEHISSLLDSMTSCKGSVYLSEKHVSHICAVNPRDGMTAYHRVVQSGDSRALMEVLLNSDHTAVNIQDIRGSSPLHLACKLGRRKQVDLLVSQSFVDLNCRTLDGTLPEEMTTNKTIVNMVKRARQLQPIGNKCPLRSIPSSWFGSDRGSYEESNIDFDQLNTRFAMLKHQMPMGDFDSYL